MSKKNGNSKSKNNIPIELTSEDYSVFEDNSNSKTLKLKNENSKPIETRGRSKSAKGFKKIAQNSATEVMQFLLSVVRNEEISTRDRILASKELLDRGFGKSLQEVQTNNNNTIRVILDTTLKKLAE